jgi:hypothetical protein
VNPISVELTTMDNVPATISSSIVRLRCTQELAFN